MFSKGQCLLFEREFHHVIRSPPELRHTSRKLAHVKRARYTLAITIMKFVVGLKFGGTFFWTMKKGPKWHRGILHAVNKHEQWITMGIQMRFDQLQKTHKIKAEVTAKKFFCLLTIACNSFMRSSPVLSFSHSLTNPWINNSTKRKKFSWKTFSHEKT